LWAAIHLQYDAYGIGMIFVCGILLGYARMRTGSVLLCMVMHAFMNLVATIQTELVILKE
jgi:membrane protease YdiL (CAAX protease family)